MTNANTIIPELSVKDIKKSLEFYVGIIGFTIDYDRPEEKFAMLKYGNSTLMIDQIDATRTWRTAPLENPLGRGINFQIQTKSVERLKNILVEKNINLFMDIEEKIYTVDHKQVCNKQFLVQDPDGYLLRFFEEIEIKN